VLVVFFATVRWASFSIGMTVSVPGNRVYIRLLSDVSIGHVGFRVAGASCYDTSELTQLYTDGLGNVTVKWYKPKGTQSFQLQRAEVDPATGRIGPWTTLVQGTGATSHKDTTAGENTYYAYRLRVYSEIHGQKYYAKFHTLKVYNFAAAQITGGEALAGDPAQIRLTWQPVQNGSRYEVLRAETSGGPYAVVGETAVSTYTDTPPEMKTYYYKVKAYATVAGAEHPTYGGTPVAIGFPTPPEGLRLEGGPDGAAELRWDACAGAKGYIVYRSSDRDSGYKRQAAVQQYIPDEFRARLNAYQGALTQAATAVLTLAVGALGEVLDLRLCLTLCGVITMSVCFMTVWKNRAHVRIIYETQKEQ
jgi:hypothetical protein